MFRSNRLFINGEWVEQTDGNILDNYNPANDELINQVHLAGPQDVEKAVASAFAKFQTWSNTLAHERELLINRAADVLEEMSEDAIELLITETGSSWLKASAEVRGTVDLMRCAAGEARRVNGEVFQPALVGNFSFAVRQPAGVVLAIAPFNYPLLIGMKKVVYAIAAADTVVLKPASFSPVTGLLIARVFEKVGTPAGVVNVIPCPGKLVGELLVPDPRVQVVSFTGSEEVGQRIGAQAGALMKKVTMELGGKNPLIVLDDYNVDDAVRIAGYGAFLHQGQVCMCTSRLIVEEKIYDEFCEKMVARAKGCKVGDPNDRDTVIGPLIKRSQCDFIDEQIKDALDKGAKLLCGGKSEGPYYWPTVLCDVTPEMRLFHEESFGPVTVICKAIDAEEALELCNNNWYGLSAALLTNDFTKGVSMSLRIDSGKVHVNNSTMTLSNTAPSGGFKMSGIGKENGRFFIEEFTKLKWVSFQYLPVNFSF